MVSKRQSILYQGLIHLPQNVCESSSVVSNSLDPMDYRVHGILQARILEWVAFPFSGGSSQPRDRGIKPRSPALQLNSLPAEPQGKPKNIGVGSLSLLQQIFPTQESNWGLLHLRQILYQLSYQGSPSKCVFTPKLLCFQKLFTSSRSLAISQVEKI